MVPLCCIVAHVTGFFGQVHFFAPERLAVKRTLYAHVHAKAAELAHDAAVVPLVEMHMKNP